MDLVDVGLAMFGSVPPRATRCDDVLSRAQETAHFVGIGPERRIKYTVGVECLDGRLVVGGEHPRGRLAAEFAGVFADLLRTIAQNPDQLVRGIVNEMPKGDRADIADAPLNNAILLVDRRFDPRGFSLLDRGHWSS